MGQSNAYSFSCRGCGARYRWVPELAGARIRCAGCGARIDVRRENVPLSAAASSVAAAPPPSPAPDEPTFSSIEEAFEQLALEPELVEEPNFINCPACAAEMSPEAIVCVQCGHNRRSGRKETVNVAALAAPVVPGAAVAAATAAPAASPLNYFGRPAVLPPTAAEEEFDLGVQIREWYAPVALILAGLGLSYAQWMHFAPSPISFQFASVLIGLRFIIDMALLMGAAFFVLRVMQTPFGAPVPALLKMTSIALLPGAVDEIVTFLLEDPTGWIGWFVSLLLIYAMLFFLFDMDFFDICILTTIVWITRIWLGLLILGVVMKVLTGDPLPATGAPIPDSSAQPKTIVDQILNEDGTLRIDPAPGDELLIEVEPVELEEQTWTDEPTEDPLNRTPPPRAPRGSPSQPQGQPSP